MVSKNKISDIRKLHTKKFREESDLFIVEGIKSVKMLCESDFAVMDIFATEASFEHNSSWLGANNVTLTTPAEMEKISAMQTTPEILAIARQKHYGLQLFDNEPVIALDHISDPGNLGTIIRTADWFGIHNIVCSANCVEFYNPKTIQATMGSFISARVVRTDLPDYLGLMSANRRVIGAFMNGKCMTDFIFQPSDIIVIGNESNGISDDVSDIITDRISIPRYDDGNSLAESLNAGIAAAILICKFRGL